MNLNKQFTILLASCIALLSMGVSCKDKNNNGTTNSCDNPGTCQTVLEAKEYFLFNYGSWWVYEEETSHERDSMYVILSNNDPNSYGFECNIKSSLTDFVYYYWSVYYQNISGCSTTNPIFKHCIYVRREKGKFQNDLGESNVFFISYKVGDFIYTGGDMFYCPDNKIHVGAILDTFTVSNFDFQKTVRIDEDCCFQEGKQPTKFYYTKGVGIVRKEFIDSNQVWNLVNYHIAP